MFKCKEEWKFTISFDRVNGIKAKIEAPKAKDVANRIINEQTIAALCFNIINNTSKFVSEALIKYISDHPYEQALVNNIAALNIALRPPITEEDADLDEEQEESPVVTPNNVLKGQ